jgi:hypothetical protein
MKPPKFLLLLGILCLVCDGRGEETSSFFFSPGVSFTGNGKGLELTANQFGEVGGAGALVQYEPHHSILNIGGQLILSLFLLEAGYSSSDLGTSPFIAPNLVIPLPIGDGDSPAHPLLNVFYRFYPGYSGVNSWGFSLKVAIKVQ